jgi:hypothetical protein
MTLGGSPKARPRQAAEENLGLFLSIAVAFIAFKICTFIEGG